MHLSIRKHCGLVGVIKIPCKNLSKVCQFKKPNKVCHFRLHYSLHFAFGGKTYMHLSIGKQLNLLGVMENINI